ncbi:sugar transferase [Actinomyces minihominis]|uniref:sugar transferase n=1 Tax=Actinomyces minihominis TaxID=2002838 RepID=UPI0024141C1E|nr:sugar transferase [Actinomyces minihominis]
MTKTRKAYDPIKRGLDILVSAAGLVALAPVMGVVAATVRANLGSPVIFKQDRPGKDGQIFTLYKFRTMKDVDPSKGLIENEDRLTSFGKALRSTSLDELPELWNVLKGDMSLVGPRPLLVEYLELYSHEQKRRHEVRPGITGLAQVSGRNALDWPQRFELDVQYVDGCSIGLDVKVILKTITSVVSRTGVTSEGHAVGAPFLGSDVSSQ